MINLEKILILLLFNYRLYILYICLFVFYYVKTDLLSINFNFFKYNL